MNLKELRQLLTESRHCGLRLEDLHPSETVYKAIIVRDFMREKNIDDVQIGIRKFFAFQRERLQHLGFVLEKLPARKDKKEILNPAVSGTCQALILVSVQGQHGVLAQN